MKRRPGHGTVGAAHGREAPIAAMGRSHESPPRWRVPAIAAWASFLGAIPILLSWIGGPPAAARDGATLTWMFFAAWLCAALPASIAALLSSGRGR